ncbi:hypothetical protein COW81_03305 [Candidatus Campbellbacteria bacterium CG22_combo_CG10-13_8_21_14_all_36_13]|uniref:Glycosyltransferase 2-like domain-containing protein n=1 Tax=Candidatus Campbellbacteria bacterium CG22_combo_CG10-13_8_21_14_all_36_13 TaxID=1974529 RepID=A0A2H0DXF9_9BACT|nr:MAG: hypothetical protein COW81_03305 [Candidatus Campbellbacteria bacterium CG22_combo_CG10-13_8_21_14_all_36_13]
MQEPLISVIIPARNSSNTLREAVLSIVNQTYKNLEILIIDDFSTDNTLEVATKLSQQDPRLKVYSSDLNDDQRFDKKLNRNINAGYSARNTGFSHVNGEFITFQDADDVSLLNRVEIQYTLLKKHDATHLSLDWQKYEESLIGTSIDLELFTEALKNYKTPKDLYSMAIRSKGCVAKISKKLNSSVPFNIKRMRVINKLFFGTLESYPGAGNSPLFKKEVIEKVQFRPLSDRIWPSFMGRGADRDFNFQVAETFKNSYVFSIPTYLWRQETQNKLYK